MSTRTRHSESDQMPSVLGFGSASCCQCAVAHLLVGLPGRPFLAVLPAYHAAFELAVTRPHPTVAFASDRHSRPDGGRSTSDPCVGALRPQSCRVLAGTSLASGWLFGPLPKATCLVISERHCPPPADSPYSRSVTPFGAFPAPGGTARLCFSGSFRNKSCPSTPNPKPRDKISCGSLPKKRRLPLGAGRLASLRAWVSRARFGQFRFGGLTPWHSTKTQSDSRAL